MFSVSNDACDWYPLQFAGFAGLALNCGESACIAEIFRYPAWVGVHASRWWLHASIRHCDDVANA